MLNAEEFVEGSDGINLELLTIVRYYGVGYSKPINDIFHRYFMTLSVVICTNSTTSTHLVK